MVRSLLSKYVDIQVPVWLVIPFFGVVFLVGVGGGYIASRWYMPQTTCPESADVCEDFGVFWQAWSLARDNFVDPDAIDPDMMTTGAVNGMLDTLGDRGHTRFLSAESAREWDRSLSGEYEGIGAFLDMRDGQAMVSSPIKGSPAEKAGVQAGDFIIKVDDEEIYGLPLEEVAQRIRGPKGTSVRLTLQRPNQEGFINVTVRRDTVEVPSVEWDMLSGDIAMIHLDSFAQRSADEMRQALTEAQDEGARMVILDLRNNHGGLVNEAIGVASQFLPEGTAVFQEQDRDGNRMVSRARGSGVAQDIPLVVLINFNTASSAEIVSGALQDDGRARLIGVRTVGTGTVLTPYQLQGGAKLLLGTVQWLTPEGRVIRGEGIAPDIEIALPVENRPLSPSVAASLSLAEISEQDAQLAEAIDVLAQME